MERLTRLLLFGIPTLAVLAVLVYMKQTQLLLYLIAILFFFAVVARTSQLAIDSFLDQTPRHIPTEPIVLMTLGFYFLFINVINVPFATVAANVADIQIRAVSLNFKLPLIDEIFGFGAACLLASFSKVFWTHLNLEEGNWGPLPNYRERIRQCPIIAIPEFMLRVLIAIAVVLLQKTIAEIKTLPNVEKATSWSFENAKDSNDFLYAYQHWIGLVSNFASTFFIFIIIWLCFATYYNYPEDTATNETHKKFWKAVRGTLFFAFPGLFLSCTLRYMITGSPFSSDNISQPDFQTMMISSGLIAFFGIIILADMFITLVHAIFTLPAFFTSLNRFLRPQAPA